MSEQTVQEDLRKKGGPGSKIPRKDGWSKEILIEELQSDDKITLWQVFTRWSGQATPFSLRDDFRRWLKSDEEFASRVKPLLADRGLYKSGKPPRRTRREHLPKNADWKVQFGINLFESGSRLEAANKSPYSWDSVSRKLDPNDPMHDEELHEIVKVQELRYCAEMEGGMVKAFRDADSPKDKAWIAKQYLERRDPKRWGRQVEMIVSGKVEHKHSHVLEQPREVRLLELAEDQKKFFGGASPKMLPETTKVNDRIIDVEAIEELEYVKR